MAEFPTYEQMAKKVAEKALDEFLYDGKSIREWMKIIVEQEPKTGHWIDTDSKSFEFHKVYKCSKCGTTEIEYPESIYKHLRYCPNCGAKMESEVNNG